VLRIYKIASFWLISSATSVESGILQDRFCLNIASVRRCFLSSDFDNCSLILACTRHRTSTGGLRWNCIPSYALLFFIELANTDFYILDSFRVECFMSELASNLGVSKAVSSSVSAFLHSAASCDCSSATCYSSMHRL